MAVSLLPSSLVLSALIALAVIVNADNSNFLLTGDVLPTDGQLSYGDASFIIQDDCNLVLYNGQATFQSNTHGLGVNCSLTLNDVGQLVIKRADGSTVWMSRWPNARKGTFAAVLHPDGHVKVYGSAVWATPQRASSFSNNQLDGSMVGNSPTVKNVLFSSQSLYDNAMLATRDYTLVMESDCNLALTKGGSGAIWQSGSAGKGQHCFSRLDHSGQLTVADDKYNTVWASQPARNQDGEYALILQNHGQVVVYGPVVWSTGSS